MRIGITGITGFLGSRAARTAFRAGHDVIGFSRSPKARSPYPLRPFSPPDPIDASDLDAVFHFAAESIIGRWTPEKKASIRESRIVGTQAVIQGIAEADPARTVLVSASGIGYYGDCGNALLDESAPAGEDFLSHLAADWEAEALKATALGARTAVVRIGFVLDAEEGAMQKVLPLFRAGLGGKLGGGHQWMAPIHADDVANLFLHIAETEDCSGAYNACIPEPCTNATFTKALAKALHRPAICHAPSFTLRLMLGELSSLLLSSTRAIPKRALESGFRFRADTLDDCLRAIL